MPLDDGVERRVLGDLVVRQDGIEPLVVEVVVDHVVARPAWSCSTAVWAMAWQKLPGLWWPRMMRTFMKQGSGFGFRVQAKAACGSRHCPLPTVSARSFRSSGRRRPAGRQWRT